MMGMALFMYLLSIWLSRLIYGRFSEEAAPILRFSAVFPTVDIWDCPSCTLSMAMMVFLRLFLYCRLQHHFVDLWLCHVWRSGTKREIVAKVFANPCIVAVYVGMIIFIFHIPIPEPVESAVTIVGDMTMPISMLIIGAVISSAKLKDIFSDWRVYLSSFVRLILMPLIALALTRIPGIPLRRQRC